MATIGKSDNDEGKTVQTSVRGVAKTYYESVREKKIKIKTKVLEPNDKIFR